MRNREMLFAVPLLCLTGLPAFGRNSSISAEIRVENTAVKEGENFSVSTVLRNTGTDVQVMRHDSCGYGDLWTSDSRYVRLASSACEKPGFLGVTLKPGEVYREDVQVYAKLEAGVGEGEWVTFRLGFKSEFRGEKEPAQPNPIPQTLWSNPVTVKVARGSTSSQDTHINPKDLPADGNGTGGVTITHVNETTHYDPSRRHAPAIMLTGTQILVEKSDFVLSDNSKTFKGTVTVTNRSPSTIGGPFQVLFDSLTTGVTVVKAAGDFGGWQYVTIPNVAALDPGESASVNVQFSNPENRTIEFIPLIYSGILD